MNSTPAAREPIRQVCAIPFRRSADGWQFCLITSLKKRRWIYPKGIIDPGESIEQTAVKEAYEEAGLYGCLVGQPLGSYADAKWGTTLDVTVVLLEVTRCDLQWPESHLRQRRWADAAEASGLVSREALQRFTALAIDALNDRG
jgi:8-oxo-dGTP pyrophosphatase MutT (NUDIX family)